MKLMGAASLALAGPGACTTQPPEKVVPYVAARGARCRAIRCTFATAMLLLGTATGLLVESHVGRRRRSRATRITPRASVRPTRSRRRRSSSSTTRTARRSCGRVDEILGWEQFQAAPDRGDTGAGGAAGRASASSRRPSVCRRSPRRIAAVQQKFPARAGAVRSCRCRQRSRRSASRVR